MTSRFGRRPAGCGPTGRTVWLVAMFSTTALLAVVLAKIWPI